MFGLHAPLPASTSMPAKLREHFRAASTGAGAVCVVCPAHNASQTLSAAVRSVRRQTFRRWTLVIVDDGSTDETLQIARSWAKRDHRISVLTQANEGVAAARNRGTSAAEAEWLLFLDADDSLDPAALKRLLAKAHAAPEAGVVVARAARLDRMGKAWPAPRWDLSDPFALLAYECGIVIDSALVKRDLVLQAGGFDEGLRTAEDWDLWQRLARMGVAFAQLDKVVAFYRSRPGSLSKNTRRLLRDTLTVIGRGVTHDPRVKAQAGLEHGARRELLDGYVFNFSLWSAVREIAAGSDGVDLLKREVSLPEFDVDAQPFANMLADGMADYLSCRPHDLAVLWDEFQPKLEALFHFAFPGEARTRVRDLLLLYMKNACGAAVRPSDAGSFKATVLDVTARRPTRDFPCVTDDVVQLWGRGPAGLVGLSGHAPIGPQVSAQLRKIGLRPSLVALHPWDSARFWRAVMADGLDTARVFVNAAPATPGQLRALAVERSRLAIESGLSAVIAAKLGCDREAPRRGTSERRRPRGEGVATEAPILMYHHITPRGGEMDRYAVSAEVFRQQLEELKAQGCRSLSTAALDLALRDGLPFTGRPVMLTFDDGYADFADCARPILREFGFSAVVLPVSAKVGRFADWDGDQRDRLMDWSQLRQLMDEGVEVGSHSRTHRALTRIPLPEVAAEAQGSASEIADHLGCSPTAFCFPYGARDVLVDRLVSEAGYQMAFSCRPGFCRLSEDPLNLPRIEITGWDSLESFRRKLRF